MPINYSSFAVCANNCATAVLPSRVASACECKPWSGRLNDLYFIDCSLTVNETNLLDLNWWDAGIDAGKIFNMGVGIGGYKKKGATTFDAGGCYGTTVEQVEWSLTYELYCVDKSSVHYTHSFASKLLNGAMKNYNLIARYCDGENTILPIGKVVMADMDNELPTDTTGFMKFSYEFTWRAMDIPTPLEVAGLSSVLAKAVR